MRYFQKNDHINQLKNNLKFFPQYNNDEIWREGNSMRNFLCCKKKKP